MIDQGKGTPATPFNSDLWVCNSSENERWDLFILATWTWTRVCNLRNLAYALVKQTLAFAKREIGHTVYIGEVTLERSGGWIFKYYNIYWLILNSIKKDFSGIDSKADQQKEPQKLCGDKAQGVTKQSDCTFMCVRTQKHTGLGSKGQQGDADPNTEIHTRFFLISGAPHMLFLNRNNSIKAAWYRY